MIEINEEDCKKIYEMLNWITTTLTFWKLDNKWPCNLIGYTVDEIIRFFENHKS